MKSAFLTPFFGRLPPYFPYWARSCEANRDLFHWFVYHDHSEAAQEYNSAVTLIPYRFEEMAADFQRLLGLKVPYNIRKVCDYRLLFYFLRRDRERLEGYDFIGYTDVDMIYGQMAAFLPAAMAQYAMISGDDEAPCGPFTLIRRDLMPRLAEHELIRQALAAVEHQALDESRKLLEIVCAGNDCFCFSEPLQPSRTPGFNFRKTFAIWDKGGIQVWDNRGHRKQGGFYHFSRFKDKPRFRIDERAAACERWGICKYGIVPLRSRSAYWRLFLSLVI